jgi:integrase
MSFNDKNISKLNRGILRDAGTGLYVRATEIAPGKVTRAFYLHWRVDGKQRHQKIGEWVASHAKIDEDAKRFTAAKAQSYAEDIKAAAAKSENLVALDAIKQSNPSDVRLKDKLREFYEEILFSQKQKANGVKLTWFDSRNKLTYMPVRSAAEARSRSWQKTKQIAASAAAAELKEKPKGKPIVPEPRYRDYKLSHENPKRYPVIDKDHYWSYVGNYNNYIATSNIMVKATNAKQGPKLMNCPYAAIPPKFWKELHKEIKSRKSQHIANDVLEMLRVFYNWCIVHNKDPNLVDNPITEALSIPSKGPRQKKLNTEGGTWFKIKAKDKDILTNAQLDKLRDVIEDEIIAEPKNETQRAYNRSLLFILLRLYTGVRPDVAEYLKWEHIEGKNKNKDKITVISKGDDETPLHLGYIRERVFDRIIQLNSREPNHPYIFASEDKLKRQCGTKKVSKVWAKVAAKAGITSDWKFYLLKHTAITIMMRLTMNNAKYVSQVTGVSVKTLLEYYYQDDPEAKADDKITAFWDKPKLVVSN